jgi:hypothetical protein
MLNRVLHAGTEKGAEELPFLRGNQRRCLWHIVAKEAWTALNASRCAALAKVI